MNYCAADFTKRGKVFATLEEAAAYSAELLRRSGCLFTVTETKRKVTHTYNIKED